MNLLPIIYFIVIFSSLNMSLQTVIQERNQLIEPDRVQHSLNQLALAQYQYYAHQVSQDPENAGFAPDIATLRSDNFISIWDPDPRPDNPSLDRYAVDLTNPDNLILRYKADSQGGAGRIAARLGPVAQVVRDDPADPSLPLDTVEVSYARPIDSALMGIFLPRDASLPMTDGPLITKDLIVEGTLRVRDDPDTVPAEGNLIVRGNSVLHKRLTVHRAADMLNTLLVNGETTLNNTLNANGESKLNGTVSVDSLLQVLGPGNQFVVHTGNNTTELGSPTDFHGRVNVYAPFTANQNLTVSNDATIRGTVNAQGKVNVTGELVVDDKITAKSDLEVRGYMIQSNP